MEKWWRTWLALIGHVSSVSVELDEVSPLFTDIDQIAAVASCRISSFLGFIIPTTGRNPVPRNPIPRDGREFDRGLSSMVGKNRERWPQPTLCVVSQCSGTASEIMSYSPRPQAALDSR